MRRIFMVFAGLFVLCSVAVAQDESQGTVSVGVNLGVGIPRGDFADGVEMGPMADFGLTWSTENYRATVHAGYDQFGEKDTLGVKGKFYPITAGYFAKMGKVAFFAPYIGAEFGSHLSGGDFEKSYFSLTPVIGGSMEIMEDLTGHLNIKYHMLLEDPGVQYFGVTVGVEYAIMK